MTKLTQLDRGEILRYLGWKGSQIPPSLEETLQRCMQEALEAAAPAFFFLRSPVRHTPQGELLERFPLLLPGKDIAAHLAHSQEAFLLCATIGLPIERLIRTRLLTAPEEGVILDACATQAIEQTADLAEAEVEALCRAEGHGITWRYSPGYGDLPLAVQGDLIRLTDAPRKIGLSVNDSLLMTPGKSVTAILGVTPLPQGSAQKERSDKCSRCPNREQCAFRKRGITC